MLKTPQRGRKRVLEAKKGGHWASIQETCKEELQNIFWEMLPVNWGCTRFSSIFQKFEISQKSSEQNWEILYLESG